MTFEELGRGSAFHRVYPTSNGFKIAAASNSEECLQRFHDLVADAMAYAEGYEVQPHKSDMDPKGRYDFAEIRITD